MYHNFLIHSSANGHLGCFHVLAVVDRAVMNIGVHASLLVLVSLVCMPSSEIAGSYGSSISSFEGISTLVSIVAVLVCIPNQQCKRVPFSSYPLQHLLFADYDSSHSDWCEMVPHCGFDLHFSDE